MQFYIRDTYIKIFLLASIVVNFFLWLWLYLRIPVQAEPIILRYNIYVGISLIGDWYKVFYFPLAGFVIILINYILSRIYYKKNKQISRFLLIGAFICQLILAAVGVLLVLINS